MDAQEYQRELIQGKTEATILEKLNELDERVTDNTEKIEDLRNDLVESHRFKRRLSVPMKKD